MAVVRKPTKSRKKFGDMIRIPKGVPSKSTTHQKYGVNHERYSSYCISLHFK